MLKTTWIRNFSYNKFYTNSVIGPKCFWPKRVILKIIELCAFLLLNLFIVNKRTWIPPSLNFNQRNRSHGKICKIGSDGIIKWSKEDEGHRPDGANAAILQYHLKVTPTSHKQLTASRLTVRETGSISPHHKKLLREGNRKVAYFTVSRVCNRWHWPLVLQ